jgi:predicted MFS family arabinose efflux permease
MKNKQITIKEYAYLIYAYASISTFVLMTISRLTDTLEKALNLNSTVSLIIILNMIVFISSHFLFKRNHIVHKQ